jgi:hypothetical protein
MVNPEATLSFFAYHRKNPQKKNRSDRKSTVDEMKQTFTRFNRRGELGVGLMPINRVGNFVRPPVRRRLENEVDPLYRDRRSRGNAGRMLV